MNVLIDIELLEEAVSGLIVYGGVATEITVEKIKQVLEENYKREEYSG